ncbi:hypothetical protein Acr_28g0003180 [Actinidia rufa]|uniref:Uncharacterized protein n=1 Tax=Actinidia rufa TaxID=165716 RepID=A0A7J0H930_9ERIC|nr:hypothetical protein Acr_28g0003180 [Actinidia rufa]
MQDFSLLSSPQYSIIGNEGSSSRGVSMEMMVEDRGGRDAVVCRPSTITELVAHDLSKGCLSPNPLDRGKTSLTFSMEPRHAISTEIAKATIRVLISGSKMKCCLLLAFGRGGGAERQAPSPSLRERSSSSESSKTPSRARRGRSPHRGDHIEARNKSTSQKIRDLDARLDAINTGTNAPVTVDTLIRQTEQPFTERVLRARISSKFKLSAQLGIYEGKTDLMDHLDSCKSLMSLQGCSDEVMCKAFSATLKEPARSAKPTSIAARGAAEELAEAKRRRRGKDDHKKKEPDTRRTTIERKQGIKALTEILNALTIGVLALYLAAPSLSYRHSTPPLPKGYLRKFVVTRPPPNSLERRYGDNRPTLGDIQTIHGGFGSSGCSTSSRKKHARSALRLAEEEIYNLSSSYVGDQTPITFSNDDLRGLHLPHYGALVVSAVIANFNVQRILIDNGSSADILFISAFERMKIGLDKLHPFHTP